MYAEEDMLLLSGIQHFAFCRRQWALIHVEQQWQENVRTLEGMFLHEKAHESRSERRGDTIITRNMPVVSRTLGVRGNCDVVEFLKDEDGIEIQGRRGRFRPSPVEYKRGKPKGNQADELQLCLQAMCLEEMLVCDIPMGYLYYGETKRRVVVTMTDQLRKEVKGMLEEMHNYFSRGYTPVVKRTKSCNACSLVDLCMPAIMKTTSVRTYIKAKVGEEETV